MLFGHTLASYSILLQLENRSRSTNDGAVFEIMTCVHGRRMKNNAYMEHDALYYHPKVMPKSSGQDCDHCHGYIQ